MFKEFESCKRVKVLISPKLLENLIFCYTVWKFHNFSITQNVCTNWRLKFTKSIIFRAIEIAKTADFELMILQNWFHVKSECKKNHELSTLCVQDCLYLNTCSCWSQSCCGYCTWFRSHYINSVNGFKFRNGIFKLVTSNPCEIVEM